MFVVLVDFQTSCARLENAWNYHCGQNDHQIHSRKRVLRCSGTESSCARERVRCCNTENKQEQTHFCSVTEIVVLEMGCFLCSIISFDLCGSTNNSRKRSAAREICSLPQRETAEIQTALQQRPHQQKKLQVPRGPVARPTPRPPPPRRRFLKPRRHHPRHRGCGTRHLAWLVPTSPTRKCFHPATCRWLTSTPFGTADTRPHNDVRSCGVLASKPTGVVTDNTVCMSVTLV